jgi:cytochrome c5
MLVMLVGAIAILVFVSPQSASSQKKIVKSANVIPDNVSQILKKSCGMCHNAGGNGMAQSVWSISSWDQYKAKKQIKKASAMCKAITNGSMPPASAGKDRKPTSEQKDEVCKWATSLQVKK